MQKSVSPAVVVLCIVIVVAIVAAIGWWFLGRKPQPAQAPVGEPAQTMGAGAQQKLMQQPQGQQPAPARPPSQ